MASRTVRILCLALLTLSLLINLYCIVEARESTFFSRYPANEYSPKDGENGVTGYQGSYGTDHSVSDLNNRFSSVSGDGVNGGAGYGSGSGTAYEESNKAYFAGSYGAYRSQNLGKEGAGASYKEHSTNTVPASFEDAESQKTGGAGNGYGSQYSTPYRSTAGSRDEFGTVDGSTSRFEQVNEFASGYGVRSGSNSGYGSSYNADGGYRRNFDRDTYNPGSRGYDRNAYGSNSGTKGGYEQTETGYGEYVGGGN